jgi:zinc transport system ATP-binding protein
VARGLEIGHDGEAILPPIDLQIDRHLFWAVVGPNGAGKSTFVRTLLDLDRPIRGTLTRASDLRPAYVPQQATLDPIFPVRVLEFVLMGRIGARRLMGPPSRADHAAARTALRDTRAGDLENRLLRDLSGGQRQRVLFSRALASDANLYILDEPTAALDIAAEREVLDLISALRDQRGATVLMITHLVDDCLLRADRALLLDRDHGTVLAGTAAEVRDAPELRRLYGPLYARANEPPSARKV